MITFKKIRYKNFLSTGNHFTEVNFQKNNTNLIVGSNGSGKSTILDALTFVLFNKSFRKITKPQLINSTNEKDCVVEIEFSINDKEYMVRRGIKPNIFDIIVDGVTLHKESDDRSNQRILEENILKLNYKSFTQIVILGSSSFVPFMQLTTANRREVIEDLLDIRIFSVMSGVIKDKIRLERDIIKSLNVKKESLFDKVEMQSNFIEELENLGNSKILDSKNKIISINQEIDELEKTNEKLHEEIKNLISEQDKLVNYKDKLVKLNNLKGKISQKVSVITEEYEFFDKNTVCPTCTQTIEDSFRLNRISDAKNKARELKEGYEELEKSIKSEQERERLFNALSKEINKLTHDISQNNTRSKINNRQIRDLEHEIQTITSQLQDRNSEHEKLEQFKENLHKTTEKLSDKKQEIVYYDFANSLLKDDGVKTKIIKKYLPLINKQVNRYLQMMEFFINFKLDEEFDETIESPIHEDFSYSSFSEGEKMRIDLALLFTWREVARIKNSVNTNLLIMDEVFDSSLDGFGTEEFLKIIKYVIKDANIFVISHKVGLEDRFDSVTKFEKVKGFSRILK
jgi:DNA repair exonuclease SbcCD ATPase subunit